MSDVTGYLIESWVQKREAEDVKPITVQQNAKLVRPFLKWAEHSDLLPAGTAEKMRIPDVPEEEVSSDEVLRANNAYQIKKCLETYRYASRNHALFAFMWETACRGSGAVSLDRDDLGHDRQGDPCVEFVNWKATGTALKNGNKSERVIQISDELYGILQDYIQSKREDVTDEYDREPLFTTSAGRISRQRIYNLDKGIYGQHLNPEPTEGKASRSFYGTLADYSCIRDGTHVFFFLGREIYYGSQINGPKEYGGFYLNGQTSEMGREADASLVWDESERYIEIGEQGKFLRDEPDEGEYEEDDIYCQPFLIQFNTDELTGNFIVSDQFYVAVSQYRNLLPGNSLTGAGFCTLTPGETEHLITLLEEDFEGSIDPVTEEDTSEIDLRNEEEITPFKPEYGISRASEAKTELHLEGSLAANPSLCPPDMRPEKDTICRQVPLVPPKSELDKSDREDFCYYDEQNPIRDGTVPTTIIELKNGSANYETAKQIVRYLDSMYAMFGDETSEIEAFVYANRFTDGTYTDKPFDDYIIRYEDQIHKRVHDKHFSETTDLSEFS